MNFFDPYCRYNILYIGGSRKALREGGRAQGKKGSRVAWLTIGWIQFFDIFHCHLSLAISIVAIDINLLFVSCNHTYW